MIKYLIFTLLFTSLYTVVRYIVFGNVSIVQLPVFLLNKSISMASVLFLFYASLSNLKQYQDGAAFWGRASFHCALIHILLSLSILSRVYYEKFFSPEKMNWSGELSVMFGVLAIYCFWFIFQVPSGQTRLRIMQTMSCFFITAHLIAMGLTGWITVNKWHGGLPPISLVCFVFSILTFLLFLKAKEKSRQH